MSSGLPVHQELLRLLLARHHYHQQQEHQSASTFAAPAPSHHQQPGGLAPPAPAAQCLSQLMEYLQANVTPGASHTPVHAASEPYESFEQLQQYVHQSGALQTNNAPAAPAMAQQFLALPQTGGTIADPPTNGFASYQTQLQQQQLCQAQQQQFRVQAQQLINQKTQQQRDPTSHQRKENILASMRLLSEIDPRMAAEAVMQVLNMSSAAWHDQHQHHQQSNAQAHQQLQPRGSSGQHHHPQALTPSPSSLSQQLSSPSQPECKPSAPPPADKDGGLSIASCNHGIIKPPEKNGTRVSTKQQLVAPFPSMQVPNASSNSSCMHPLDTGSKSLANGVHVVAGKCADNRCKSKVKSQEKESPPKALQKGSKKHQSPIDRSTNQSQNRMIAPTAAADSEGQGQLSVMVVGSLPPPLPTPASSALQSWSLDQLEMHVQQLKQASQPVPQRLAVLLFNRRRKEEKRKAKRLANRKSATVSRARKKTFIEDMAKDNAMLRKRANILNCLPDMVISISMEGNITFCGGQVENVLKHNTTKLLGANIREIVVPDSLKTIQRLIQDLVGTVKHQSCAQGETVSEDHVGMDGVRSGSGREAVECRGTNDQVISVRSKDESCPMLEVNANALQPFADEEVTDSSVERLSKNHLNSTTTESYESSERSSSSCESSQAEKGKKSENGRRLVPVYEVCFIRDDLTTVWCELTYAILCVRSFFDDESSFDPKAALGAIATSRGIKSAQVSGNNTGLEEEDELLLCIRPTYDGKKMGEEFRFACKVNTEMESEAASLSNDESPVASSNPSGNDFSSEGSSIMFRSPEECLPEKHQLERESKSIHASQSPPLKKQRATFYQSCTDGQDVQSIAESLMLMSYRAS